MKKIFTLVCACLVSCALPFGHAFAQDEHGIYSEQPAGTLMEYDRSATTYTYDYYNGGQSFSIGQSVGRVVYAEDGTVWVKSPFASYPLQSWIKGKVKDNQVVFDTPQTVYYANSYGYEYYFVLSRMVYNASSNTYEVDKTGTELVFDIREDGIWQHDASLMVGLTYEDGTWTGYGDTNVSFTEFTDKTTAVPAGVEMQKWVFNYGANGDSHNVKVGFDGNDVYVSGLVKSLPDGVVKGKVEGDKVTFEGRQYVGADEESMFHLYMMGATPTGAYNKYDALDAIVFDYNAEEHTLNSSATWLANGGRETLYPVRAYDAPALHQQQFLPGGGVPADPSVVLYSPYEDGMGYGLVGFNIPAQDVNGTLLDTENLYFNVFYDDEKVTFYADEYPYINGDMTDIPYDFSDGYEFFVSGARHTIYIYSTGFDDIGVQTVYRDGDTELRSNIVYYYNGNDGISRVGAEALPETWYDLQGRRASKSASGIRIVRKADGKTQKVF